MKTTFKNTMTHEFDPETKKNIDLWLNGQYDRETKSEVINLIENRPQDAIDAFYTSLSFGTGGMRGIMGVGSNRMNVYTIRAATQGLANYLKQQNSSKAHRVFIGFDSRHHSNTFAAEAARVLAGNAIQVELCRDLRPTPLISFGCRLKKCSAAIMITASHNPPEYNGYKVFWSDGGQVMPPHDQGIIEAIAKITDPAMVKLTESLSHPLIHLIDESLDEIYVQAAAYLQLDPAACQTFGKELNIVYTSLHGTGITLMPKMLKAWGFPSVSFVDRQIIPDGNFSTVNSPNPEDAEALSMGIQQLKETQSDLLIATDPDADRVGVAVMHQGESVLLNGNQIACLCLAYVCEKLIEQGRMPSKAAFIKTIGTSELFQAICDYYDKACINVLTGFKYIAEKIREWENTPEGYTYVFGGEESFGYLLGSITRDKDGILSSALIAEMALHAKRQHKTLVDLLYDLYRNFGVYTEDLLSVNFNESKSGKEQMALGMAELRKHLPQKINEIDVVSVEDYQTSESINFASGKKESLNLPKSNVLLFWLADESKLMVRPSGTEPKIKLYCGVVEKGCHDMSNGIKLSKKKASQLLDAMKRLLIPNVIQKTS